MQTRQCRQNINRNNHVVLPGKWNVRNAIPETEKTQKSGWGDNDCLCSSYSLSSNYRGEIVIFDSFNITDSSRCLVNYCTHISLDFDTYNLLSIKIPSVFKCVIIILVCTLWVCNDLMSKRFKSIRNTTRNMGLKIHLGLNSSIIMGCFFNEQHTKM